MTKKKIISIACAVMNMLYPRWVYVDGWSVDSSNRIRIEKHVPSIPAIPAMTKYIIPISLGFVDNIHRENQN